MVLLSIIKASKEVGGIGIEFGMVTTIETPFDSPASFTAFTVYL